VGAGACLGSLGQWSYSLSKSKKTCNKLNNHIDHHHAELEGLLNDGVDLTRLEKTLEKFSCWLPQVQASTAIVPSSQTVGKPMTRFSVPEMKSLVAYDDYVLHFDRRTRNPNWVFEHLTSERVKASGQFHGK
jgi:endonuclease G